MISNWKNLFGLHGLYINILRVSVNTKCHVSMKYPIIIYEMELRKALYYDGVWCFVIIAFDFNIIVIIACDINYVYVLWCINTTTELKGLSRLTIKYILYSLAYDVYKAACRQFLFIYITTL